MPTKKVRNRTDMDGHIIKCQQCAKSLVQREESRTFSRMVAYENVARMIGTSSAWLRRFINNYGEVTPSFPVGMNIIALYEQVCTRVEQETARSNQRAAFIEETIREVTSRNLAEVEGSAARAQVAARLPQSHVPGMDEGVDETG